MNVVEITLINSETIPCFSFFSSEDLLLNSLFPNLFSIALYAVWTSFPITTWNCPPLFTTEITPDKLSIFLTCTLDISFNSNLNLVAQCVNLLTLDGPPTNSRTSNPTFL